MNIDSRANIFGDSYEADALQNTCLKNDHLLNVPFPTLYDVEIVSKVLYEPFTNPSIQYVIALGRQTNKFFLSFLPITILANSYIQMCAGILVPPILIDAKEHFSGGREAKSIEVPLSL